MNDQTNLLWWAITGRIPGDDEDTCHVVRATTEPEARHAFADLMFESEVDPQAERKAAVEESGGDLGVFINSVVWSHYRIQEASGASARDVQPGPFVASNQFVRGPARPSGSGFKEFVIKLPNHKQAAMTAETLNEFARAWSCQTSTTGRGSLPAAIESATQAGELDELADYLHPDVINQFCDAVSEMEKSRLEKAQALGFATVEEMHAHQAWIKQTSDAHKAETAFQATPEAQKLRDDANVPPDTWVSTSCAANP